jgi:hypothetical protein
MSNPKGMWLLVITQNGLLRGHEPRPDAMFDSKRQCSIRSDIVLYAYCAIVVIWVRLRLATYYCLNIPLLIYLSMGAEGGMCHH